MRWHSGQPLVQHIRSVIEVSLGQPLAFSDWAIVEVLPDISDELSKSDAMFEISMGHMRARAQHLHTRQTEVPVHLERQDENRHPQILMVGVAATGKLKQLPSESCMACLARETHPDREETRSTRDVAHTTLQPHHTWPNTCQCADLRKRRCR